MMLRRIVPAALIAAAAVLGYSCGAGGRQYLSLTDSGVPSPESLELDRTLAELEAYATPKGVDPAAWELLKAELGRLLEARGVSAPPANDASAAKLRFFITERRLEWDYYFEGDYDQNGEVNITDLSVLGLLFGRRATNYDFERGVFYFQDDTLEQIVDADHNGEINLGDLVALGRNFGQSITHYNVYGSAAPADHYPASGAEASKIAPIFNVDLSQATGDPRYERLRLSLPLPNPQQGHSYWVRPSDGGSDGTPSNILQYDEQLASDFVLEVKEEETFLGGGSAEGFELSIMDTGDDIVIEVRAIGAEKLKLFLGYITFDGGEYDPYAMRIFNPVGSSAGMRDGPRIGAEEPGSLMVFVEGYSLEPDSGGNGDITHAELYFARRAQDGPLIERKVPENRVNRGVGPFPIIQWQEASRTMTWFHSLVGDYNQNGVVNMPDLISLAMYFGKFSYPGGFDPSSIEYIVDGDGNGSIDINDLNVIGYSMLNAITGYNIYAYHDPVAQEPPDEAAITQAAPVGHVPFSASVGDRWTERLSFAFPYDPEPGTYMWIRPEYEGEAGWNDVENMSQIMIQVP